MNANTTILVADDEESIADSIAYALQRENYKVLVAYEGESALHMINQHAPDVAILDVMMPKLTGYDVCRQIAPHVSTGILMLTAKSDLVDKVLGLELGADDYMTKPFDMIELLARVRSLCRRLKKGNVNEVSDFKKQTRIIVDQLIVDPLSRQVFIESHLIEFKPKEFDLLFFLLKNKEHVFSRDDILKHVWAMDYLGGTRTVDIHIQRIRNKLGAYGDLIQTVSRIGYKAKWHAYEK